MSRKSGDLHDGKLPASLEAPGEVMEQGLAVVASSDALPPAAGLAETRNICSPKKSLRVVRLLDSYAAHTAGPEPVGARSAVQQQGSATHEIALNVEQASQVTQEVTENILGISKSSNDTMSSSDSVLTTENDLGCQSELLKSEMKSYLKNVASL